MGKGNTFAGLLAGLGIGTALGILFAPEKGSETRKKIANKGKNTLDEVKNKYDESVAYLNSKLDEVKKKGTEMYDESVELIEKSIKQ